MFTVRSYNARVDVPPLEEQIAGAAFASGALPDDPELEREMVEAHGWDSCPIYSPEEEAEMYEAWAARNAELSEVGFMSDEPRVA